MASKHMLHGVVILYNCQCRKTQPRKSSWLTVLQIILTRVRKVHVIFCIIHQSEKCLNMFYWSHCKELINFCNGRGVKEEEKKSLLHTKDSCLCDQWASSLFKFPMAMDTGLRFVSWCYSFTNAKVMMHFTCHKYEYLQGWHLWILPVFCLKTL